MIDLQEYRKEIDKINLEIVELLRKRQDVSRKIGELKRGVGKEVLDGSREQVIFDRVMDVADEKSMDGDYIRDVFKLIIQNSREVQE